MFKFLKERLKQGIKSISNKIEEEGSTEQGVEEKAVEEKKGFFSKLKEKFVKKEKIEEFPEEEAIEEEVKLKDEVEEYQKRIEIQKEKVKLEKREEKIKEEIEKKEAPKIQELAERKEKKEEIKKIEEEIKEPEEERIENKKGFFHAIKEKITTKKVSKEQFEKIFWDLEIALLENNVAVEVIEKIKDDLTQEIVDKPLRRGKIEETVTTTLKTSLEQLLSVDSFNLLEKTKTKKPFVICFVGINGSGKTTTIAKVAKLLKDNNLTVVLVAGDTWRQAAIEQIEEWAKKLKLPLVKHSYGSDPAAVAFDGIKMAKARGIDVVLIDTAGRMHSNINLTEEMKKIVRVAKPDLKIFVGESITGNDCVEQSKKFNEAIELDGIILSKADVDEKGGAAISVSYVTQKPIIYLGTGQGLDDLKEFDPSIVMGSLGLA